MRYSETQPDLRLAPKRFLEYFEGVVAQEVMGRQPRFQGFLSCLQKKTGEITLGTRLHGGKWKAYYVEPFLVIVFFMLSHDPCAAMQTTSKGLFRWRRGPQVSEVTRLGGVTRLSIFFHLVYIIGRVTRHMLPHLSGVSHLHVNRP